MISAPAVSRALLVQQDRVSAEKPAQAAANRPRQYRAPPQARRTSCPIRTHTARSPRCCTRRKRRSTEPQHEPASERRLRQCGAQALDFTCSRARRARLQLGECARQSRRVCVLRLLLRRPFAPTGLEPRGIHAKMLRKWRRGVKNYFRLGPGDFRAQTRPLSFPMEGPPAHFREMNSWDRDPHDSSSLPSRC